MSSRRVALSFVAATLAACSAGGLGPAISPTTAGLTAPHLAVPAAKKASYLYWTLFESCSYPQIQFVRLKLKAKSKASDYNCSSANGFSYSSGMHIDAQGRLWVIYFGQGHGSPGTAAVFKLPLKTNSLPEYTFVLAGTQDPDHLTFDPSGNLWVNSHSNGSILEYAGPFTKSATLTPTLTITKGITTPNGIAIDKSGNLYVSLGPSTGTDSIAVFTAPITSSSTPYYLNGLSGPGGLIFDKNGNLYASINVSSLSAIVRYDKNDLSSGDSPSIVDPTDLSYTYESDFAFDAGGNLYFANCGSNASIYLYPTGTKPFSSSLKPSLDYSDPDLQQSGCGWGIAIH